MYKVNIYENKNGKSELKDYIKELKNKNDKNNSIKFVKIISYIRMLQERGLALGTLYIKHLVDNIWELRPLRDRILFASLDNNEFILLNIFIKKTQKTPQHEILKAKKYLEDYIRRR